MNFQPLGKRVLIERQEEMKTTATGIIIPDNASKEKPLFGKVIAVGSDVKEISEGDNIVFAKYCGTDVKLDDKDYLILKIEDILGILK